MLACDASEKPRGVDHQVVNRGVFNVLAEQSLNARLHFRVEVTNALFSSACRELFLLGHLLDAIGHWSHRAHPDAASAFGKKMRRTASRDDDPILRSLLQEDGAIVRGETAGVGLPLPEMRAVHVEPFHLLGVDVEALGSLGDQLLAALEAITQFARCELTELDTPAAYLLTNRDNRHRCFPQAGELFSIPEAILGS